MKRYLIYYEAYAAENLIAVANAVLDISPYTTFDYDKFIEETLTRHPGCNSLVIKFMIQL